jgi:hypothetical protein
MSTLPKQIKEKFKSEFEEAFLKVNNNMSVGFGEDDLGNPTLEVRLTNDKLKNVLPSNYQGLKVNVMVIGKIEPYKG